MLPSPDTYNIINKAYEKARITVLGNETSEGNAIAGGFYQQAFVKDGFDVLSEYNFTLCGQAAIRSHLNKVYPRRLKKIIV